MFENEGALAVITLIISWIGTGSLVMSNLEPTSRIEPRSLSYRAIRFLIASVLFCAVMADPFYVIFSSFRISINLAILVGLCWRCSCVSVNIISAFT